MIMRKIGVFSPSGLGLGWYPKRVQNGIIFFVKKGFEVVFSQNAFNQCEYAENVIGNRVKDFYSLLKNEEINVLMASIGGYYSIGMLEHLDYNIIANCNKKIYGYSDVTALLIAIYVKTGKIVFHGPTFLVEMCEYPKPYDYTSKYFFDSLHNRSIDYKEPEYQICEFIDWNDEEKSEPREKRKEENNVHWTVFNKGYADGFIIGGNLETLLGILGTEFLPHSIFDDKILFLEDRTSDLGHFEAMLYSLKIRGILNKIKGLIIGKFENAEMNQHINFVLERTFESIEPIPAIYNVDLGHTTPMITIPIGGWAELEAGTEIKFSVRY